MRFDLSNYDIRLVVSPVDMRSGFRSLSTIANTCLHIDVTQGRHCVVFISSSSATCKAIWCDKHGNSLLTRTLKEGRFKRLLVLASQKDTVKISVTELLTFLDGGYLQTKRKGFTHII